MDHRIREAMEQNDGKLFGTVQVDETYTGGKHKRKQGFKKKAAIMGMTEEGGRIKAFQIPWRETHILLDQIRRHVDKSAFIKSDEASAYKKLPKIGYRHGSVKHGKRYWSHKGIDTNSIESFWALFKRCYHGTYHSMSKKHLQRYINEVVFRFNTRKIEMDEKFAEVVKQVSGHGKLSYKKLTA